MLCIPLVAERDDRIDTIVTATHLNDDKYSTITIRLNPLACTRTRSTTYQGWQRPNMTAELCPRNFLRFDLILQLP